MNTQQSLFLAVGILLCVEQAQADERVTIGGLVGAHLFSPDLELGAFESEDSDSPRNSVAFGIRAGYELLPRLRVEAELAIIPSKTRDSSDDLSVFAWRTHALVDLLPQEELHPFVLAGVGFLTLSPTAPEVLEQDTDLAGHVGLGLELEMGSTWALRGDMRVVLAPTVLSDYLTTDFEVFVGATKYFPSSPTPLPQDLDGDGVFDDEDQCLEEAEDQDGFEDDDGCPELDNDEDGVLDAADLCPVEAESKNGVDDEDGCPEPDGDGDGVLGSDDKCPQEPENINGVDDTDGCPEEEQEPVPLPDVKDEAAESATEAATPSQ